MNVLLIYTGKVAALLAAFYLFYKLLLSRETLHRLNRRVLVGILFLSALLPFCILTIHKTVEMPETAKAENTAVEERVPAQSDAATGVTAEAAAREPMPAASDPDERATL